LKRGFDKLSLSGLKFVSNEDISARPELLWPKVLLWIADFRQPLLALDFRLWAAGGARAMPVEGRFGSN
jgi:hypothetical protein